MIKIPLIPVPDQQFNVTLDGQNCTIRLFSRMGKLFMDLAVDETLVFAGLSCVLGLPVNSSRAYAFAGELWFIDTEAQVDPAYEGLGSRFQLLFISEAEL